MPQVLIDNYIHIYFLLVTYETKLTTIRRFNNLMTLLITSETYLTISATSTDQHNGYGQHNGMTMAAR